MTLTPSDFQHLLTRKGFDVGPAGADGAWGNATAGAAKTWFKSGVDLLGAAVVPPEPLPAVHIDRVRFFAPVRAAFGALDQDQVNGFTTVLDEWERRKGKNLNWLAYMLATAWWETGKTMQPVREAFWVKNAEAWRKKNLRYYPYYGRGLVQLTWEFNYRNAGQKYGIDLVGNPDLALDPATAVKIMFDGMDEGWFTAKALDDYIDDVDESDAEDLREYTSARRVINGTDKAATIGQLGLTFERALRAA